MNKEPLWMPRGSVRSILALMLIGTVCWLALTDRVDMAAFVAIAAIVVNAYFEQRRQPPAA